MFRTSWLIVFALGAGIGIGILANYNASLPSAHAQDALNSEPNRILVQGHARAISTLKPPGEQFTLIASNAPRSSFKVVPPGKKFILTDVLYETQGNVRQNLTVNIANANHPANTTDILFQVSLGPAKSDQIHLCSGYVIQSGNSVVTFTNAGLAPEQYVSVSVTGYLVDQ